MRNKKVLNPLFSVTAVGVSRESTNMKKSPKKKMSPKGKRKLDFPKPKSQGTLFGKTFYLDFVGQAKAYHVRNIVEGLGGKIEGFFSKDINCLLTDKKGEVNNATKNGLTRAIPSPLSGPNPLQQLSSNKCSLAYGNSPLSTDSPQSVEAKRLEGAQATRGQAFVNHASKKKSGSSNMLSNAKQWGVRIKHVDDFILWAKSNKIAKGNDGKKQLHMLETNRRQPRGSWVRKLKPPFIKVEDQSRMYRPLYIELEEWPVIYFDSARGSCPFEKPQLKKNPQEKEETSDKETDQDETSQDLSEKASPAIIRKEKKGNEKKDGYCECCCVRFEDMKQHVLGEQHRAYATNDSNYAALDKVIARGKSFEDFLAEVKAKYDAKKAIELEDSSEGSEDDIPEVKIVGGNKTKADDRVTMNEEKVKDKLYNENKLTDENKLTNENKSNETMFIERGCALDNTDTVNNKETKDNKEMLISLQDENPTKIKTTPNTANDVYEPNLKGNTTIENVEQSKADDIKLKIILSESVNEVLSNCEDKIFLDIISPVKQHKKKPKSPDFVPSASKKVQCKAGRRVQLDEDKTNKASNHPLKETKKNIRTKKDNEITEESTQYVTPQEAQNRSFDKKNEEILKLGTDILVESIPKTETTQTIKVVGGQSKLEDSLSKKGICSKSENINNDSPAKRLRNMKHMNNENTNTLSPIRIPIRVLRNRNNTSTIYVVTSDTTINDSSSPVQRLMKKEDTDSMCATDAAGKSEKKNGEIVEHDVKRDSLIETIENTVDTTQTTKAVRKQSTLHDSPPRRVINDDICSTGDSPVRRLRDRNNMSRVYVFDSDTSSPVKRLKNKEGTDSIRATHVVKEKEDKNLPVMERDITNLPTQKQTHEETASFLNGRAANKIEKESEVPIMKLKKRKSGDKLRGTYAQYEIIDTELSSQIETKSRKALNVRRNSSESLIRQTRTHAIKFNSSNLTNEQDDADSAFGRTDEQDNRNQPDSQNSAEDIDVSCSNSFELETHDKGPSASTPIVSKSKKKEIASTSTSKRKSLKFNRSCKETSEPKISNKVQSRRKCFINPVLPNKNQNVLPPNKQRQQNVVQEIVNDFMTSPTNDNNNKEDAEPPVESEIPAEHTSMLGHAKTADDSAKEIFIDMEQYTKIGPENDHLANTNLDAHNKKRIIRRRSSKRRSRSLSLPKEQCRVVSSDTETLPPSNPDLSHEEENIEKNPSVTSQLVKNTSRKSTRSCSSIKVKPVKLQNNRKRSLSHQESYQSTNDLMSQDSCNNGNDKNKSIAKRNLTKNNTSKSKKNKKIGKNNSVDKVTTPKKPLKEHTAQNSSSIVDTPDKSGLSPLKEVLPDSNGYFQVDKPGKGGFSPLGGPDAVEKDFLCQSDDDQGDDEVIKLAIRKFLNSSMGNVSNEEGVVQQDVRDVLKYSSPLDVLKYSSPLMKRLTFDSVDANNIICRPAADQGNDEVIKMVLKRFLNSSTGNVLNKSNEETVEQETVRDILSYSPPPKEKLQNYSMEHLYNDYEFSDASNVIESSEPDRPGSPCIVSPPGDIKKLFVSSNERRGFLGFNSSGKSLWDSVGTSKINTPSLLSPLKGHNAEGSYISEQPGFARPTKELSYTPCYQNSPRRRSTRCKTSKTPPSKAWPLPRTPKAGNHDLSFDPSSDGNYEHINYVADIITGLPSPHMILFASPKDKEKPEINQEEVSFRKKELFSPPKYQQNIDEISQQLHNNSFSHVDQVGKVKRDINVKSMKPTTTLSTSRKRTQETITPPSDLLTRVRKRSRTNTGSDTKDQVTNNITNNVTNMLTNMLNPDVDMTLYLSASQTSTTDNVFEQNYAMEFSSLADRLKRNRRPASQTSEKVNRESYIKERKRLCSTSSSKCDEIDEDISSESRLPTKLVTAKTGANNYKLPISIQIDKLSSQRKARSRSFINCTDQKAMDKYNMGAILNTPTNTSISSGTPGSNPLYSSSVTLTPSFVLSQSSDMLDDISICLQSLSQHKPLLTSPNIVNKLSTSQALPQQQLSVSNSDVHRSLPTCRSSITRALQKRRTRNIDIGKGSTRKKNFMSKCRKSDSKFVHNFDHDGSSRKSRSRFPVQKYYEGSSDGFDFNG